MMSGIPRKSTRSWIEFSATLPYKLSKRTIIKTEAVKGKGEERERVEVVHENLQEEVEKRWEIGVDGVEEILLEVVVEVGLGSGFVKKWGEGSGVVNVEEVKAGKRREVLLKWGEGKGEEVCIDMKWKQQEYCELERVQLAHNLPLCVSVLQLSPSLLVGFSSCEVDTLHVFQHPWVSSSSTLFSPPSFSSTVDTKQLWVSGSKEYEMEERITCICAVKGGKIKEGVGIGVGQGVVVIEVGEGGGKKHKMKTGFGIAYRMVCPPNTDVLWRLTFFH